VSLARWVCPTCNEGKLAPRRPRRDDVRRYCLPCSEKSGRLVSRVNPTLESKRQARKARAAAKRRAKYVFKPPRGYYVIAGINTDRNWEGYFKADARVLRVRTTKGRGPVAVSTEGLVTLRKGPWADRYDALAQIVCGWVRKQAKFPPHGQPWGEALTRRYMRDVVAHHLRVRPRLDKMSQAEVETAGLLRSKAAVELLGNDSLGRRRGTPKVA
jgi:hypothetical protein